LEYCEAALNEAFEVNTSGTENVARCCKEFGAKLVFISTDNVFFGSDSLYTESSKQRPANVYGETKTAAEKYVMNLLSKNAHSWLIIRLSVLYGYHPLSRRADFVSFVIDKLKQNEKVQLFMDKYRNFTYLEWLAKVILMLSRRECGGIYHVCGDECINNLDFGMMIAEEFGLPKEPIIPSRTDDLTKDVVRPKKIILDNSKLRAELGEDAMMPTIRKTLDQIKRLGSEYEI